MRFSLRVRWWAGVGLAVGIAMVSTVLRAGDGIWPVKGFSPEQRGHWAFQPLGHPEVPGMRRGRGGAGPEAAAIGPVDAFLAAAMERAGVEAGPEADRETLIRRLTLDLVGIPPTPEEMDAFLADQAPGAYERVVDRLLGSAGFGERWARVWLDLARYAESEGFKADETRPNAWRYRDYVIRAFNEDRPYDRFVQEQIAGDELWPDDPEARVATGFNRHYPDESNARNLVQRRQEILDDITDTVGSVFTGLTFACARCHDHKWDPITQADYFRLQAFFAHTAADDAIPLAGPAERLRHARQLAAWERATREIREEMACLETPGREAILADYVDKYPAEIQAMLRKPPSDRTPFEHQMVSKAGLYLNPVSHQYLAPPQAAAGRLKDRDRDRYAELKAALLEATPAHPGSLPLATGVVDLGEEAPPTHLLRRGRWDAPGERLEPGFLTILGQGHADIVPVRAGTTGRRAALARLLTDPSNPLTARVMVNRLWHHHFGRGLVGTPSDFGLRGEAPTHPELLDWLARDFMAHGWSLKHVHRRLVTSAAYRRSSAFRSSAASVDPGNRLLWRFPRRRLEGEMLRDSLLAVAGRLNPKPGGPGVFPDLPDGFTSRGGWPVTHEPAERDRRSIYVFVRRNTRYPMFEVFDQPDTHESCPRRNTTTSPLQALTLLNSALTLDWARSMACRVLDRAGDRPGDQAEAAWRMAFGRRPSEEERVEAVGFLVAQRDLLARLQADGGPVSSLDHVLARSDPAGGAALADLCHALMNANEFVYLD